MAVEPRRILRRQRLLRSAQPSGRVPTIPVDLDSAPASYWVLESTTINRTASSIFTMTTIITDDLYGRRHFVMLGSSI